LESHGEYASIEEARAAIKEIFGEVRYYDEDAPPYSDEPPDPTLVERYNKGKYRPLSDEDICIAFGDWFSEDIHAKTTDEEMAQLANKYEAEANTCGESAGIDRLLYLIDEYRENIIREKKEEQVSLVENILNKEWSLVDNQINKHRWLLTEPFRGGSKYPLYELVVSRTKCLTEILLYCGADENQIEKYIFETTILDFKSSITLALYLGYTNTLIILIELSSISCSDLQAIIQEAIIKNDASQPPQIFQIDHEKKSDCMKNMHALQRLINILVEEDHGDEFTYFAQENLIINRLRENHELINHRDDLLKLIDHTYSISKSSSFI